MKSILLDLYKAQDGLDAYAIAISPDSIPEDQPASLLAQKGFGSDFEKVWTVELQSSDHPDLQGIGWDAVLDRAIEAYHLSDPIITDFEWPSAA